MSKVQIDVPVSKQTAEVKQLGQIILKIYMILKLLFCLNINCIGKRLYTNTTN